MPILFAISLMVIAPIASAKGIFYMRPELPTLITVLLFPLTWIYIGLRRKPSTANKFAGITAAILLTLLSISTVMETASIAPMIKIDREFKAPEGWVAKKSHSDAYFNPGRGLLPCPGNYFGTGVKYECPAIGRVWKQSTEDLPFTMADLEDIATTNQFNDFTASGECGKSFVCELSGEVDGTNVSLRYIKGGNQSLLILDIKESDDGYMFE